MCRACSAAAVAWSESEHRFVSYFSATSVPQRLATSRAQSRQEVPHPLDIPLGKIHHRHSSRYLGSAGGGVFILGCSFCVAGFELSENLYKQLGSKHGILGIKTVYDETPREIETLLCQDVTGISTLVHPMYGHSGPAVAMVIQPEQRVGSAMTRKQRRVNV